ncbi:MAG: AMP-dependent synthetase, partial [Aquihabitans sp.]
MQVPLTVIDFLDRAVTVYPARTAFVDEPNQPAPSWGTVTVAEMAARAKAQAVA